MLVQVITTMAVPSPGIAGYNFANDLVGEKVTSLNPQRFSFIGVGGLADGRCRLSSSLEGFNKFFSVLVLRCSFPILAAAGAHDCMCGACAAFQFISSSMRLCRAPAAGAARLASYSL